jgi:hypothetical protein
MSAAILLLVFWGTSIEQIPFKTMDQCTAARFSIEAAFAEAPPPQSSGSGDDAIGAVSDWMRELGTTFRNSPVTVCLQN